MLVNQLVFGYRSATIGEEIWLILLWKVFLVFYLYKVVNKIYTYIR